MLLTIICHRYYFIPSIPNLFINFVPSCRVRGHRVGGTGRRPLKSIKYIRPWEVTEKSENLSICKVNRTNIQKEWEHIITHQTFHHLQPPKNRKPKTKEKKTICGIFFPGLLLQLPKYPLRLRLFPKSLPSEPSCIIRVSLSNLYMFLPVLQPVSSNAGKVCGQLARAAGRYRRASANLFSARCLRCQKDPKSRVSVRWLSVRRYIPRDI